MEPVSIAEAIKSLWKARNRTPERQAEGDYNCISLFPSQLTMENHLSVHYCHMPLIQSQA